MKHKIINLNEIPPLTNESVDIGLGFIAFNRPHYFRQCLTYAKEAYKQVEHIVPQKDIYLFIDGPKSDNDKPLIEKSIQMFKETFPYANIMQSPTNEGPCGMHVSAAKTIFANHDNMLIIEDDVLVDKYFYLLMFKINAIADKRECNSIINHMDANTRLTANNKPAIEYYYCDGFITTNYIRWKSSWEEMYRGPFQEYLKIWNEYKAYTAPMIERVKKWYKEYGYERIGVASQDGGSRCAYSILGHKNVILVRPSLVKYIGILGYNGTETIYEKHKWGETTLYHTNYEYILASTNPVINRENNK